MWKHIIFCITMIKSIIQFKQFYISSKHLNPSYLKKICSLLIISIFIGVNSQSQIVIEDSVFTTTLDIVGSSWNNAIIKNCTFKNTILSDGVRIANANNVTIDSCIFYNIQGNGIRLHPYGTSIGVIIKNCSFDSIYGNGILSDEQHSNTQILNNNFNWIGLDTVSASQGAPHHGIYFVGNNFLISGNRIRNIYNNYGNCVSVRSNGIVCNNILSDATKNGISYFSDHPNIESTLLIENNIVYNCQRGVSIADGGEPYVDSSIIRFNTFITDDYMSVSIGSGLSMINQIYGNIFIRKDGGTIFIYATSPFDSSKNVSSNVDIGFVDFINHNYHITPLCIANSYANGIAKFPLSDFEGDLRFASHLDAGADQNDIITNNDQYSQENSIIYPNPAKDQINIIIDDLSFEVQILNTLGQTILLQKNIKTIDVSCIPKGTYILIIKTEKSINQQKVIMY